MKADNNKQLLEKEWADKTIAKGEYSNGYIKDSQSKITIFFKYIHSNGPEGSVLNFKDNS